MRSLREQSLSWPLRRLHSPSVSRTLRVVPHANLTSLDPVWDTAWITRNHGYLVYDTLYSVDNDFVPQPQMAAGHDLDDDGRLWTIHLREGLRFHDGEPVRARDVTASIGRWARRDSFGGRIAANDRRDASAR